MNRNICIVHRSPIIALGLQSILTNHFDLKIMVYRGFDDHKEILQKIAPSDILFVEEEFYTDQIENKRYILITRNKGIEPEDFKMSVFEPADSIVDKTNKVVHNIANIASQGLSDLTSREIDILKLVAFGNSNKEIADKLFISAHTVISHRKNITDKLGIKSISGLTVYAIMNGIIDTSNIDISDLI